MKTLAFSRASMFLVAVGLAGSLVTGVAQVIPPATLVLTEADNGTTADAVVGQAVSVNLRGNITTGYAWVLATASGGSVVTNGPVTYTPHSGGGVGVGGTFGFPFVAVTTEDTILEFEDRPPGGGVPAKTFTVTVHVLSQPMPPSLSIKLAKPNVIISWPIAGSANFSLEGSPNFGATQWAPLNVLPLSDGTNYTVTLGIGGSDLLFRLHQL